MARDDQRQEQERGENEMEAISALDLLREDHRKVQELFEEFEQADKRSRQRIAEQALEDLEIHTKLEEGLIYPAIRQEIDDEEIMDMALEEHHVATLLIKELRKMEPKDERYQAKFKVLAESVRHHIEEEESQILPQAEELDLDFEDLGQKAMAKKEQLTGKAGGGTKKKKAQNGRPRKRKAA
ncbi:hemerythrin domain-containing protein [Candidatus Nitrospira bockiana]